MLSAKFENEWITYRQRFHRLWVWDEFRTDILYYTASRIFQQQSPRSSLQAAVVVAHDSAYNTIITMVKFRRDFVLTRDNIYICHPPREISRCLSWVLIVDVFTYQECKICFFFTCMALVNSSLSLSRSLYIYMGRKTLANLFLHHSCEWKRGTKRFRRHIQTHFLD